MSVTQNVKVDLWPENFLAQRPYHCILLHPSATDATQGVASIGSKQKMALQLCNVDSDVSLYKHAALYFLPKVFASNTSPQGSHLDEQVASSVVTLPPWQCTVPGSALRASSTSQTLNLQGFSDALCFCSPPSYLALLAVFGHVIDGLDTLDRMEKIPSDAKDRPKQEIKIERVTIHANPLAT
eukprot:1136634-Pelagomonas_calceolata.AAC.1